MGTPTHRPATCRVLPSAHGAPPYLVMVSSVAWEVTSQILMLLSTETEATFWLSGSKQHAVTDLS